MQESLLIESIFAVSWALILCVFAIPPIIFLSHSKNLLDEPGERRVHQNSTPRLGGLAIFAAFVTSSLVALSTPKAMLLKIVSLNKIAS